MTRDGVVCIRGDARSIELPDDSLDLITCHHSIEHFRDDQDITAIQEFSRILKPGGIAVITPVFLCNHAAEIWNGILPGKSSNSPGTMRVVDRTSPFPGWGPFEGYARVYSIETFSSRIIEPLRNAGQIELFSISFEGAPCPDVNLNNGLPTFCESMIALAFTKWK